MGSSEHNSKPRFLGRGVPPSQPMPRHLAASIPDRGGTTVPKVLIGVAVGLGVAGVAVAVALSWNTLFAPAAFKASPHLTGIGQVGGASSIDLALAIGEDMKLRNDQVVVERVWIDSCQRPGPGRTPADKCDRQPFFERALVKAIMTETGCAPERPKDETISFALEVSHPDKRMRLFVGRSGSLGGKDAKSAVQCIERALPQPDWASLEHDHTRYVIGVLASYPAEKRQ